jgi:hypothetical protein
VLIYRSPSLPVPLLGTPESALTTVPSAPSTPGAPSLPSAPAGPVGPTSPLGIVNSKTAAFTVPELITVALVPGAPVVVEPTVTVAAAPSAPSTPGIPCAPSTPSAPGGP